MRARRPRAADLVTTFWSRVERTPECWLWQGAVNSGGYGTYAVGGRSRFVHRFSYEISVGPIPTGLELDHLCSVRTCVRPDHLEPVTRAENLRRSRERALI